MGSSKAKTVKSSRHRDVVGIRLSAFGPESSSSTCRSCVLFLFCFLKPEILEYEIIWGHIDILVVAFIGVYLGVEGENPTSGPQP